MPMTIAVGPPGARLLPWGVAVGIALAALGLVLYRSARLVRIRDELRAARAELAELGMATERCQISHDLLSQSLAAVSFKGDLAVRLLPGDPRAAREEIGGLVGLARGALRRARSVTHGEQAVSLHTETRGAQALLAAAGIDARVRVNLPGLAAPAEQVLAWAVREGVANMLRHSEARICSITGWRDGGTARLEIVNDQARSQADAGSSRGGLSSLAEQARALSGSVSARATGDGGFRLLVELPEEAP
jgi:two-component system sensor histidine kinase DesK